MSKYNAVASVVDGIRFDSKAEARRYVELKGLARAGVITSLELQPRFLLQDGFEYQGKRERKIEYVADFRYYDVERKVTVVEDVKGVKTDVYKLKRKLFLARYGKDVEFLEVK